MTTALLELLIGLPVILLAHEAGHAVMAQAMGLPWKPTVTRHGPGIIVGRDDLRLTRMQVAVTCAGGPVANLLLAGVGIELHASILVLASLEFAVVNLIPFPKSDGRRILAAARNH